MFLREDKKIGHSFSSDSQLNFSKDPANWHIQDNLLIVDWDNGDQETYLIDDSNRREIYGENRDGIETYMYKLD